jgi:hypothetical protein
MTYLDILYFGGLALLLIGAGGIVGLLVGSSVQAKEGRK